MAGYFSVGESLKLQVSGVRKAGSNDRLLATDPMHLGSCTKSMTATLIGLLVDEGSLRWESTLGDIFEDQEVASSPWKDVSISQLLRHTSGAPKNAPQELLYFTEKSDIQKRREEVFRWMLKQKRIKTDGQKALYSNLGYMVLGHIIEKIRHRPWEAEIVKHLFQPLQIEKFGFGIPSRSYWPELKTRKSDVVHGHSSLGGQMVDVEWDNSPVTGPSGSIFISMDDWVKYLRIHLQNAKQRTANSQSGLKIAPTSLEYLHTPQPGGVYAGGWEVWEKSWAGGNILLHDGSNGYWFCIVLLAPQMGRGFIAASNSGSEAASTACLEAIKNMVNLYANLPN